MTTFNGKAVFQRGGAGAGRGDDPHAVNPLDMTFDQHHANISSKNAQYAGGLNPFSKQPKSPFQSVHEENQARATHNTARAKHLKEKRGLTVEEEYG